MPFYVLNTPLSHIAAPQILGAAEIATIPIAIPEMVPRNCRLEEYTPRNVPIIEVDSKIIAFASPDSTYSVTRKLFDAAEDTILIGIYDFSAQHIKELVLAAIARGVKVTLMLDVDSAAESELYDDLVAMGIHAVCAPSCANANVRMFSSSHEKVIVIDGEWVIVQSGNYSDNSCPLNAKDGVGGRGFRTGNRDTGLAIQSRQLATFFAKVLHADIKLSESVPGDPRKSFKKDFFVVERAPRSQPSRIFPSKTFDLEEPLEIQPVLSPDNYMEVMPDLIANARSSILIEQQYIRAYQPNIQRLLQSISSARAASPELDVRIVLGKVFNKGDLPDEHENLRNLADHYNLRIDRNIRYVNTNELVHCHNKMIIIDGKSVLISSQNWSDSAVAKNREAGVWLTHEGIAEYFSAIFETDWDAAFRDLPEVGEGVPEILTPQSLGAGGFIRVARADYEQV